MTSDNWKHTAFAVFVSIVLFALGALIVRVYNITTALTELKTLYNFEERIDKLEEIVKELKNRN